MMERTGKFLDLLGSGVLPGDFQNIDDVLCFL